MKALKCGYSVRGWMTGVAGVISTYYLVRPAQATYALDLKRKVHFLGGLERSLGDARSTCSIETTGDRRPIVRLARETGVRL